MDKVLEILLESEPKFDAVVRMLFSRADKDGNMTIDAEEFRTMMFSLANEYQLPQPTEQDVRETMIKVDINRDGTIDYPEFKKFVRELFHKLIDNKRKSSM